MATTTGSCGDNLTWTLNDNGALVITGTGALTFDPSGAPWGEYVSDITSLTLPNGLTSIQAFAFAGLINVSEVTIPGTVTTIGDSAFNGMGITTIVIPDSVTSIGDEAFGSNQSMTSAIIGDGVTTIGANAFMSCDLLASVTIGSSVSSIGEWAFAWNPSLTSITLKTVPATIGSDAFALGGYQEVACTVRSPNNIAKDALDSYKDDYTTFIYEGYTLQTMPIHMLKSGYYSRVFFGKTADKPQTPEQDGDIFISVDDDELYIGCDSQWNKITTVTVSL